MWHIHVGRLHEIVVVAALPSLYLTTVIAECTLLLYTIPRTIMLLS